MFRLDELVERLGGELVGDATVTVSRVDTLERAGADAISFLANPKYAGQLATTRAAAVIVGAGARDATSLARIVVDDPYVFFARVSQLLNPAPRPPAGVAPSADLASVLPETASVGAGVTIGGGVAVGENVVIGPGCHIGDRVRLGDATVLHANVTIYSDCELGERCIVHSGAVIGADGFGFARERDGSWVKIPQVGRVIVGNDVEIGANTTIDRGTLDDTVIGDDVKLDNQIQIAHNVKIGEHTAIAGCVGIAGSTTIGRRCMIGGQAGVIGHLQIADDVVVSAGTLVSKSIREAGVYTANLPLQAHGEWVRNFAHLRHLGSLADRIRRLEQLLTERPDA